MQKPGFELRPVSEEFVKDIRTAGQCFSAYLFCPVSIIPQHSIHSLKYHQHHSRNHRELSITFSLMLVRYRTRAHLPSSPHPLFKGEDAPSVPKLIFLAYISHSLSGRECCVENSDSMQIFNVSQRPLWKFKHFADPTFKSGPANGFYHTYLNNITYNFKWLRKHSYLLCF